MHLDASFLNDSSERYASKTNSSTETCQESVLCQLIVDRYSNFIQEVGFFIPLPMASSVH